MSNNTFRDREILTAAQAKGPTATLGAWLRLSGPGWLQSAITLGGGSLGGALYLGMLAGTSMLWLQLVAIVIGVIMLSAISYISLSTRMRPYAAINEYVNPVLGVGWVTATILANMIFILPQFSLSYSALNDSLFPGLDASIPESKLTISLIIGAVALAAAFFSFRPGTMFKIFDLMLKAIIGMVVLCFVAVAYVLARDGAVNWAEIAQGFIPNFMQWGQASPEIQNMLVGLDGEARSFYETRIIDKQQSIMIGVTATAVGLNMTFLLPYSMISRGWDKNFRGFARWELITAMAIPYILVTTCIVIASAHAFHAKADASFLSNDAAEVQESHLLGMASGALKDRYVAVNQDNADAMAKLNSVDEITGADEAATATAQKAATSALLAEFVSNLSEEERKLSLALVKPNAKQLAITLKPALEKLTGSERAAEWVFGLGALGMGFSTIIILMMINGYAFAEILGDYDSTGYRLFGAALAFASGVSWVWVWGTGSQTWLLIIASTFAGILLPIAYFSFFLLMNNRQLLGEYKPTGGRMVFWNVLMLIGVAGAVLQAYGSLMKVIDNSTTGPYVVGGVVAFMVLALIGFSAAGFRRPEESA
ncbi:divalent metal cation transporter [Mariniblastus fucicola]|uniref:Natural resistance-associated macrophage protein n=1 Tax=Mariniblastus fucicola TaxID=980251 RepID=A0A5B9P5I5_9BACT|nr:divalent metal cation transporter [Mariniblastus fucicola]QEG21524.1 Natural resistance-associated macrophage protein [Mariniblastus fucicola]